MESEITQLKNEIEQLKKEKIERLTVKNAETKMSCIRDKDTSTFIVEINVVKVSDPEKLPVQIYVKYYCSDKPYEEKENIEGKTYYITFPYLPSAQVFAKYAWKRLCEYMCNIDAAEFENKETIFIPIWWRQEISTEFINEDIPRMIEAYKRVLIEEQRKLGWRDYEDNISDSDFEYEDECDEECASIDLANISKPAC